MSEEKQGVVGSVGRAVGAGVPLTINGKTYLMEAMTMEDYGIAEQHLRAMRKNPVEAARPEIVRLRMDAARLQREAAALKGPENALAREMKAEEAAILEKMADDYHTKAFDKLQNTKDLAKVSLDTVLAWLDTYDGIVFGTWLGLRKNHPEIDLEAASKLVTDMNAEEVARKMRIASGTDEEGNSTGSTMVAVVEPSAEASQSEAAKTI